MFLASSRSKHWLRRNQPGTHSHGRPGSSQWQYSTLSLLLRPRLSDKGSNKGCNACCNAIQCNVHSRGPYHLSNRYFLENQACYWPSIICSIMGRSSSITQSSAKDNKLQAAGDGTEVSHASPTLLPTGLVVDLATVWTVYCCQ